MTTIVAQQYEWGCVVASDMQTTVNTHPFKGARMVKQVERGGWIIAASGPAGPCDYVMHRWTPPDPSGVADVFSFLACEVVPALRAELAEELDYKLADAEGSTMSLILAANGWAYTVESDGTVLDSHQGIYGIGCGSDYAVGALCAGVSVQEAVRIAADNDVYTSGPFTVHRQFKVSGEEK
jgi:ATP-dependent protease HslVU (ClpYQ) peptidase subunit